MGNYAEYVIVDARGGQVGFLTCKVCSAVVMLEQDRDNTAAHDEWHEGVAALLSRTPSH